MTDNDTSANDNEYCDEEIPQRDSETPVDDNREPTVAYDDISEPAENADESVYSRRVFQTSQQSKRYTLLLFVGCAVILVALYFFGLRHRAPAAPSKDAAAVNPLDLAMAKLQADLQNNKNAKTIIDRLIANPAARQIDSDCLQRNPFRPLGFQLVNTAAAEKAKKERKQNRLKQLETLFKNYKLESIAVSGESPTCMINGELYQQGQKVSDDFMIKAIAREEVILLAEELEFKLQF